MTARKNRTILVKMKQHRILLWGGRISGLLVTLFFLYFFIREGATDILKGGGRPLLWLLPFALPSLAGYILSWWKPLAGGRVMLGGAFLLAVHFLFFGDYGLLLLYALPSLLIGLCMIAASSKEII